MVVDVGDRRKDLDEGWCFGSCGMMDLGKEMEYESFIGNLCGWGCRRWLWWGRS